MIPRGDHWAWNQSNARILYPLTTRIHLSLFKLNPRSISNADESDEEDKNSKDNKPSYKLWIYQLSLNDCGDEKTNNQSNHMDLDMDVLNNVINSSSPSKKNDGFVISFIWCEKGRDPDLDYLNDINAFKYNYSYICKCNEELQFTKPEPKSTLSKPIRKQRKSPATSSSSSSSGGMNRPKTRSSKYRNTPSTSTMSSKNRTSKISYSDIDDDDDDYEEEDDEYNEKDSSEDEVEYSPLSSPISTHSEEYDSESNHSSSGVYTSDSAYSPLCSPYSTHPSSPFETNIVEIAGGSVEQLMNERANNTLYRAPANHSNLRPNYSTHNLQITENFPANSIYPTIYDQTPSSWMTITPIPAISCGSTLPFTENSSYSLTPKPRQWEFKFDNCANNASMDNFKRNNFPLDDLFTY